MIHLEEPALQQKQLTLWHQCTNKCNCITAFSGVNEWSDVPTCGLGTTDLTLNLTPSLTPTTQDCQIPVPGGSEYCLRGRPCSNIHNKTAKVPRILTNLMLYRSKMRTTKTKDRDIIL
jgi:hypothetical protein